MDREEALRLLRSGNDSIAEWNQRRVQRERLPSLSRTDLSHADLSHADLSHTNLSHADLNSANLRHADLNSANLRHAGLSHANLSRADLSDANLNDANFSDADLSRADLRRADLTRANLRDANLRDANLSHANLVHSDLRGADLSFAIFSNTSLHSALLYHVRLDGCDLSSAKDLDQVEHIGPSFISVDTLLMFKDELPETFLRGCGLADEDIAHFRSRVGTTIRFYSCFISYSSSDEEFVTRLHNDFQAKGIRCWKWDHDARTGRSLWGEIDQAIRVYDKLVLVASESSLKSPAVNREIERAIRQEDERQKRKTDGEANLETDVLFPVRLDDYIFSGWDHERKVDVTRKVIADARGWDIDPAVYARVRDRLIRDLKPE